MSALVLSAVCSNSHAKKSDSQEKLKAAIEEYNQANFDKSLALLEEAEFMSKDKADLSLVLTQRGVILDVIGERLDALLVFVRAITVDRGLEIETHKVRSSTIRLFRCAQSLAKAGMPIAEIRNRHAKDIEADNWKCPAAPDEIKDVASVQPKEAKSVPSPELPKLAPKPPPSPAVVESGPLDDQQGSRLAWRWGFIGAGILGLAGGLVLDYTNELGENYVFDTEDLTGTMVGTAGLAAIVTGVFFNPYRDKTTTND